LWKNKFKQIKNSKKSEIVGSSLEKLDIKFEIERNICSKFVDYFLPEHNIENPQDCY